MKKWLMCYCLVKYGTTTPPGAHLCYQKKCVNWQAKEAKKEEQKQRESTDTVSK